MHHLPCLLLPPFGGRPGPCGCDTALVPGLSDLSLFSFRIFLRLCSEFPSGSDVLVPPLLLTLVVSVCGRFIPVLGVDDDDDAPPVEGASETTGGDTVERDTDELL